MRPLDPSEDSVRVPRSFLLELRQLLETLRPLQQFREDWDAFKAELSTGGTDPGRPEVVAQAGYLMGRGDVLARALVFGELVDLDDAEFDAAARESFSRYATRYGLDLSCRHHARQHFGLDDHAYHRPVHAWKDVARLLLQGLIGWYERPRTGQPTLRALCLEFERRQVHAAPRSPNTLSRWVSESRKASGLQGGIQAALAELEPEARLAIRNARAKQQSPLLSRANHIGATG